MKSMTILTAGLLAFNMTGFAQTDRTMKFQEEHLNLTAGWDKVFPKATK